VKTPVVKPKAEVAAPITATKTPTPGVSGVVQSVSKTTSMSGNKGLVLSALGAAGITSIGAQANILANVQKESNFKPRSEELPSAEKVFSMFGGPEVGKTKDGRPLNKSGNVVRFPTLQDAKNIVSAGPEAYFNKVYDGRMGNKEPGDGYKYRGRGFIQITGKGMYEQVGKELGMDLVSNPELANDPAIAAKIIPIFFKIKLRERKTDKTSLEDIGNVNDMVGSASVVSNNERKSLSSQILSDLQNTSGNQIDSISNENKELKQQPSVTNVAINNTKTIINSGSNEQPQVMSVTSPDDYPLLATSPA
jgi:predicted chitinase